MISMIAIGLGPKEDLSEAAILLKIGREAILSSRKERLEPTMCLKTRGLA
jgi:hypothetical protein